jgi:hypothetical protein
MSVLHLEMSDSSSIGRFPGNEGGGAPASIGVHIFMQMTPTCDAYNGWSDPSSKPGWVYGLDSFRDSFLMMLLVAVVQCTMHSNSNYE